MKFTGLLSMTLEFGKEVIGIMAFMEDVMDGGGLLREYGITTPLRFIPIPILTFLQFW